MRAYSQYIGLTDGCPQTYEVTALRQVRANLPPDAFVTVPEVLWFDDTANVIVMSDCGPRSISLKQALMANALPLALALDLGWGLGEFLARVHALGKTNHEFNAFFARNEEGKQLSALVTYGRLLATLTDGNLHALADPPLDVSAGELARIARVAREADAAMRTTRETVVMGDFWPGNVLISLAEKPAEGIEKVYVIDWELVKTGFAGLDIAQFVAELQLIYEFRPEGREGASSVRDAFLSAYRQTAGADLGLARRALTHIGAHFVAWTPRVGWEGEDKVRETVRKGVDLLVEGPDGTEEYVKSSLLGHLLE